MKSRILYFVFFVLAVFVVSSNIIFSPSNILSWDVFGYYLYLPLQFIYHDLGLKNVDVVHTIIDKYHNTATFYQALKMPDGTYVMKYSMGMAFFYAPFFLAAHIIALVFGFPADGFSQPYENAIFIGGIIYSVLGLWFLIKVLNHFFNSKVTIIATGVIIFATNYMVHITMYGQNAMSQNYLFTAYTLILWLTIKWHETHLRKHAILLGIILGLTILSRPTEIVSLAIPLLWGIDTKESIFKKIATLFEHHKQIIILGLIIAVFGSFQFIYWKMFSGHFLFNSYGANAGEGLDLLSPHTLNFLFSFRKGWFVFTPIAIVAMAGFYFMYKKNQSIFWALLIYFIANLYLVSSWSNWWYAQSFSQRAMVPSYPVLAIALGYFLVWVFEQKAGKKVLIFTLIGVLTAFNLFQTKQFHHGVLHGDRMTPAYYFAVFGKMNATEEDKKLLLIDRASDGVEKFKNSEEYRSKIVDLFDFEQDTAASKTRAFESQQSWEMTSEKEFSPYIETAYSQLTEKDHTWIHVTAMIYPTGDGSELFSLVTHFSHNGFAYKYTTYNSDKMNLIPNTWNQISFDYLSPEVRTPEDNLRVLFWNRSQTTFYIDDFKVEAFEKK